MAVIPTRDFSEGKYLAFATAKGMVKKTEFNAYNTPIRADGIIAIKVREGDELVQVRLTSGKDDIMMVSKSGHASASTRRRAADGARHGGVKGMNVADKGNGGRTSSWTMDVARTKGSSSWSPRTATASGRRSPSTRSRAAAGRAC